MTEQKNMDRQTRLIDKALNKRALESTETLDFLKNKEDRQPGFDYFIDLAEKGFNPQVTQDRVERPLIFLLCIQAPLELIHAAGFAPFKIFSGSLASTNMASQGLPALMCPLLRSILGIRQLIQDKSRQPWVLPTTCDWVVKFPEMLKLFGDQADPLHWMELPHIKDTLDSQDSWLSEVIRFKHFLEKISGKKLNRKDLSFSISLYQRAWQALSSLTDLRRKGLVSSVWFFLIINTFFLDKVENWTKALENVLKKFETKQGSVTKKVFLAGSPIFFPNYKLPRLMEEAGLTVVGDDLCSSERIFPGGVCFKDSSEFGLLEALAQRYHQGCLCPTFADNDRRINNILGQHQNGLFEGVVFQVLKGCHPYDLESFTIEPKLKDRGLKFIRLETDYASEDSQNLLTRLEAYRHTLSDSKSQIQL